MADRDKAISRASSGVDVADGQLVKILRDVIGRPGVDVPGLITTMRRHGRGDRAGALLLGAGERGIEPLVALVHRVAHLATHLTARLATVPL